MSVRLKPYAASRATSLGRCIAEARPALRGEYQRDRDRVIHSAAFRRLEYKTQVFVNHEGDMFRTRLTHTIEVAQVARSIARALAVNEDLTEAIALAHDLGHTPFGHAGQDALNACMHDFGGFEHNLQSLRVVDLLEERYAEFSGLNLTHETREGILKHCSRSNARVLGALGERFLNGRQPSVEAQITNLADEIAYNSHDVDDGLRAGLLDIEALRSTTLFRRHHDEVTRRWPVLAERRVIHEVVRRIINTQVTDLVAATADAIEAAAPPDIEAVRGADSPLVRFGSEVSELHIELKRFLRTHLYHHYRVNRMARKAGRILTDLFRAFIADDGILPPAVLARVRERADRRGDEGRARTIADYIAGMTDRYAIAEHARVFEGGHLT